MNILTTRTNRMWKTGLALLALGTGTTGGVILNGGPAAAQTMPKAGATAGTLASGQFHKLAHRTVGTAMIVRSANGQRMLRLSGFETGMGPELHVYLAAAPDVKDNGAAKKLVAGKKIVDLGALKSIKGDQTYVVPPDVDLSKYGTAVIWCDKFDVAFGSAPLS